MQYPALRLFPGGKQKALTLSYDDGVTADRRLVEIFNRHGLKATFHINAGLCGSSKRIPADEIAGLYQGHEVATHGYEHPSLTFVPRDTVVAQMVQDRMELEKLVGYPVRGHSYPNGCFSPEVAQTLATLGIVYARTTLSHGHFSLPDNPLTWHPTCHHSDNLQDRAQEFLQLDPRYLPRLFYVWGHAYEFDNAGNWDLIERFCDTISGNDAIWYATNIEIIDYLTAFYRLVVSYDGHLIHNPSAIPVWVHVSGNAYEIQPGQTLTL